MMLYTLSESQAESSRRNSAKYRPYTFQFVYIYIRFTQITKNLLVHTFLKAVLQLLSPLFFLFFFQERLDS